MKAKFITSVMALAALLFTGCASTITNLTPKNVPQNPSGIYTLTMNARVVEGDSVPQSFRGFIVIDGKTYEMRRSDFANLIWDFEYKMPTDRIQSNYYFVLKYKVDVNGILRDREVYSEVYKLDLTNRYVITMEATRGPVGAKIAVVGRGFDPHDRVVFGGVEADTRFSSANALTFTVPALQANESYPVELRTGAGPLPMGIFRIDPAPMQVTPAAVDVASGERALLVIGIAFPAPDAGLKVEVTTNIPESVIMPEVVIPAGSRTVSVQMEGGRPGTGKLYIKAPGFDEVQLPVTVREAALK